MWKAGKYGNVSLSDGVIEFAKTHEEIKGAFLTFQKDADQIYPGYVLFIILRSNRSIEYTMLVNKY